MNYTVCRSEVTRDRSEILALWRENLPQASPSRYGWLYETGTAAAWLLKAEEDELVGSTGVMARTLRVRGRMLRAGLAIDLNVAPAHRTVGPAVRLHRSVAGTIPDGQFDLLYGFPNPQSEAILRRIGYRVLGEFQRFAKPLRIGGALRARIRPAWAGPAAAAIVNPLLSWVSPEVWRRRHGGCRVEVADGFDQRFDTFWETGSSPFPVVGERNSAYLEWRFGQCPAGRHRPFCLVDQRGRLAAYLVYCLRDGIAYIEDFLFRSLDLFEKLLAAFLRAIRLQRAEAVVVAYLGPSSILHLLRQYGFRPRPSIQRALVYVDPRNEAPKDVFESENWLLTSADQDTSL